MTAPEITRSGTPLTSSDGPLELSLDAPDGEPSPEQAALDIRRNRKLSEVAKKLVVPEGIVGSYWPRIRETCNTRLGLSLDRWQDGIAGLALAYRSDGVIAHTVGGCGMTLPRQVGKTHTVVSVMFGLCIEHPGLLAIWTSHHVKTNSETFQAVQSYCKRERIKPFIKKVYLGSGDEAVEFTNGSRILFGARERGFGRGIPGVDVLMSDEAQILTQRAMQDMLATMNTSRLGLHMYVGTPPKPTDNSEMFVAMRREAISGEATDIAWIECGADDDIDDIDDIEQWMKANASCPHRTPVVSIQRLRRRLDDDGFRREALGIWDATTDGSAFDVDAWSQLGDTGVDTPRSAALVIDLSPDRKHCWIGVAGEVDTDKGERVLLMAVETTAATAVKRVQELVEARDIVEVAITGGAARALEPDLVEAGLEYQKLSPADIAASYSTLQESIKNKTIVHGEQSELTIALLMTKTRFLTSGESEVFDRRNYSANLSPAVACACALFRWGLNAKPMPVLL